jgi:hypothetical protein
MWDFVVDLTHRRSSLSRSINVRILGHFFPLEIWEIHAQVQQRFPDLQRSTTIQSSTSTLLYLLGMCFSILISILFPDLIGTTDAAARVTFKGSG